MAKKKHKAKLHPPQRHPNGEIKRPTPKEREAIERHNRLRETLVVRGQPHRKWAPEPGDPKLETPFGRLCVAKGLSDDLLQAGERYTGLFRKWRLAKGVPCPFGHSSDGTGEEPGYDPDHFLRDIAAADAAMKRMTKTGALAVSRMCGHREEVPPNMREKAIPALVALAVHFDPRRA